MDYTIGSFHVADVVGVDSNLQPTRTKRVTFTVGTHGPFTLDYPAAHYSADLVHQDMQKEVDTLKAIYEATKTAR